jgi:energy-coupling factor transporter ATP-binding protein EcfA2
MELGAILTTRGMATEADIQRALERQKKLGGRLGENLIALGVITQDDLDRVLHASPKAPKDIEETGIPAGDLMSLLLRTMNSGDTFIPSRLSDSLKLPSRIIQQLLEDGVNRKLIEVLGGMGESGGLTELRYGLTGAGKSRALEAMEHSAYVGPAPVSLEAFHQQVSLQKITNERVSRDDIDQAFNDLVISDQFIGSIGPAINSGRCILLYGPPGNGKTSVAERVAAIFSNVIYIPYCIQVDGQIIKVYDPGIHKEVKGTGTEGGISVRRDVFDKRWVTCERPIVITGGELTLEMLDLKYNPHARFYEAPLHVKALGGTFIIDDFGRQLTTPEELLNRWIVPLQNRVDFLKLHTGKSFAVPFDELTIFSTNMDPDDLMDPAFLRRIPYKLETVNPTVEQFRDIFERVSEAEGMELSDEIFRFVVEELTVRNSFDLACYQPRFVVDQVISDCKYEGIAPTFTKDFVKKALGNLYAKSRSRTPVRPRVAKIVDNRGLKDRRSSGSAVA